MELKKYGPMYHASKTTEWGKRKKKHEIFSKFIDTKS
jgi:hypothetical protein